MAIFRKVHVSFWSDTFTSELPNDKKLFYIYLLTNERTKQCGIYEISKRQIAFDLGCTIDTVSKQLEYFISVGKLMYSEATNEIAIKNWAKYNYSSSPKVVKCIESELCNVKNKVLIEYLNSIDTLSQEEQEEEEEEEQEKPTKVVVVFDFIKYLETVNTIFGRNFKIVNDDVKKSLKARIKAGYTKEDIMDAMLNAQKDEYHKEKNYKYCTPEFFSRSTILDKYSDVKEVKKQKIEL